jgi:DivIVA domain-containing protein
MNTEKRQRDELNAAEQEQEHAFSELQHYVPAEILNVSFPAAVGGYDRRAVDAYLKARQSPDRGDQGERLTARSGQARARTNRTTGHRRETSETSVIGLYMALGKPKRPTEPALDVAPPRPF